MPKSLSDRLELVERAALEHRRTIDKHDKQIQAIRALVEQGMRMMIAHRREMAEFRKGMRELQASQKKTDAALRAFLERGNLPSNGHGKHKIDIQ